MRNTAPSREYRGYSLACHPEGLWSYRARTWDMWSPPMTLAECKADIDTELASYGTPTTLQDLLDKAVGG
jgi:hypothetical protein